MAAVEYVNATCFYPGAVAPSVDALNLRIDDGELMVLVGPSGSGKSTALRMLAGLEEITTGQVLIDGEDVSHKRPRDRDIAMVFQNYALYPHWTVAENMAFALKLKGVPKPERRERVRAAAAMLNLVPYLDRKPGTLSGGQRQRVAMGRAIVRHPAVFLMDEPLSNLDAKLRVETRASITALQHRLGTTTVYVTHDQVEAMTMGDRVAVLHDGTLQQVDTPRRLYDRPANVFIAGFIGSPAMNLRAGELAPDGVRLAGAVVPVERAALAAAAAAGVTSVTLGVRPEAFTLRAPGGTGTGGHGREAGDAGVHELRLTVALVEELGADAYVYGSLPGDADGDAPFVVRCDGRAAPRVGEVVAVAGRAPEAHLFHPATGARLG